MMVICELGCFGLYVCLFVFGGNVFGWSVDEKVSFVLFDVFVDVGFNLVDIVDVYLVWVLGNVGGELEILIGKWFVCSGKCDKVVLVIKVVKWVECFGLILDNINVVVEDLLCWLQIDVIDLYQVYEDDEVMLLEVILVVFGCLIEVGKV